MTRRIAWLALACTLVLVSVWWLAGDESREARLAPSQPEALPELEGRGELGAIRGEEPKPPLPSFVRGDELEGSEPGTVHESHAAGDAAPSQDYAELLRRQPLSSVPHGVVKAWSHDGTAGPLRRITLVVDSKLPTEELEQLLVDVRAAQEEAGILSVEIYDSLEAASYDFHEDGGARATRHRVAILTLNRPLGVDSMRIRGVQVQLP